MCCTCTCMYVLMYICTHNHTHTHTHTYQKAYLCRSCRCPPPRGSHRGCRRERFRNVALQTDAPLFCVHIYVHMYLRFTAFWIVGNAVAINRSHTHSQTRTHTRTRTHARTRTHTYIHIHVHMHTNITVPDIVAVHGILDSRHRHRNHPIAHVCQVQVQVHLQQHKATLVRGHDSLQLLAQVVAHPKALHQREHGACHVHVRMRLNDRQMLFCSPRPHV